MYLDNLGERSLRFTTRRYVAPAPASAPAPTTRTVVISSAAVAPAAPYAGGVQQITGSSGPVFKSGPYSETPRLVSVPVSSEPEPLLVEQTTEETSTDLTNSKWYGIGIAALVILALILLSKKDRSK